MKIVLTPHPIKTIVVKTNEQSVPEYLLSNVHSTSSLYNVVKKMKQAEAHRLIPGHTTK